MTTECYVFDTDGTLADNTARVLLIENEPKDWDEFYARVKQDKPIPEMIELLQILSKVKPCLVVSGRREQTRKPTEEWFEENGILRCITKIYMRAENDHRPDHLVKSDIYKQIVADGYKVKIVFDDRTSVVNMWRSKDLRTLQCGPGDF